MMNTHTKKKQISGKSDTCYVQISHETKKNEHDFKSNSNVFFLENVVAFYLQFLKIYSFCLLSTVYFFFSSYTVNGVYYFDNDVVC